ncbi:hypothetical protein H1R20_g3166, partial [Candolleomyces eurysporus]
MKFVKKLKRTPSGRPSCEPGPAGKSSHTPSLPVEIWRKVVGYAARLEGHESVQLEDPFSPHDVAEEYPEIDPIMFKDRRSLGQVNSTLRALVTEISSEYLVIRRAQDIKYFLQLFKRSMPDGSGKRLGDRTRRIDLKIIGPYNPKKVAALLRFTPNLLVLVHQTNRENGKLGRVPKELMRGLMMFGRKIRRLDFDSINEAPALWDIIDVSRHLVRLETLRILCLHSYPTNPRDMRGIRIAHFRRLKTLSLGHIPEPQTDGGEVPEGYIGVWDPLLRYLGLNTRQLPLLERFETGIIPAHDTSFFETHGYKIRMLRVTTCRAGCHLPTALNHCVNLESLVLAHGCFTPLIPPGHHTLKRICITPSIERLTVVPPKVFLFAVMKPLGELIEQVEGMHLPCVEEFRLRDYGLYGRVVEHANFLNMWWRRFALRGIRFVDQEGKPYDNVVDRGY